MRRNVLVRKRANAHGTRGPGGKKLSSQVTPARGHLGSALRFVWAFLRDFSSVDHPSIAHLPRSALDFFVFRYFGFQVAFASTRRSFPLLPPRLARLVGRNDR